MASDNYAVVIGDDGNFESELADGRDDGGNGFLILTGIVGIKASSGPMANSRFACKRLQTCLMRRVYVVSGGEVLRNSDNPNKLCRLRRPFPLALEKTPWPEVPIHVSLTTLEIDVEKLHLCLFKFTAPIEDQHPWENT